MGAEKVIQEMGLQQQGMIQGLGNYIEKFFLPFATPVNVYTAVSCLQTQKIWHRRLRHLNERSMSLLLKEMAIGIEYDEKNSA